MNRLVSLVLALSLAACAHTTKTEPPAEPPPKPVVAVPPLDRSKPPAPGPTPDFKLPPIARFKLANGLEVALVERHALPVIAMSLMVRGAGIASDSKENAGLAAFATGLLDEGAGGRSAQQLALEIERIGASISAGAGTDAAVVSAAGLTRVLEPLLALYADVVLRPDFNEADVARVKGEFLTSILRERDQGPTMARLLFAEQLFGAHPYGSRPRGTQATVSKFDRKAALEFYRTRFSPQRAILVVSGDVTEAQLKPKLEQAFGAWKAPADTAAADLAAANAPTTVNVSLFDRPGAAQSSILVGWLGLERRNPDYVPAQVMNAIFGGMFNSRLNMNLREDKHWTYGARAGFEARIVPGPVMAGAEVQSDHTADAIAEIFKEIDRMRTTLPTEAELEAAKNSLVRSLPQRFETVEGTAGAVAEVLLYGLPADYWETYDDKVEAVTREQVQEMAKKYLQPDRFTLVVAGDLATVTPPLKALNIAPSLVVRDAEGKKIGE